MTRTRRPLLTSQLLPIVAPTVAPLHGTKVAQWSKSLSVILCGFLLGALLLSALPAARLPALLGPALEPRGQVPFWFVSSLAWGLLAVAGWTTVSLAIAAALSLPLPATLALLLGAALVIGLVGDYGPSGTATAAGRLLFALVSETAIVHGGFAVSALLGTAGAYWLLARPLEQDDPLAGTLRLLPPLYTGLLATYAALLTAALGRLYGLSHVLLVSLSAAAGLTAALLTLLWARLLMVNRTKRHVFERYPPHCLEYSGAGEERLAERGMVVGRESPTPTPSRESTLSGLNRQRAEESLAFLLLTATGLSALVQGAGDIGLVRGLGGVLSGLLTGGPLAVDPMTTALPMVSVLLAAVGIVVLTGRFAGRLAHDLTTVTPSMALAVELGCSLPGLVLLLTGHPVSPFMGRWPALLLVAHLSGRGMQRRVAWLVSGGALGSVLLLPAATGMASLLGHFIFISIQPQ